MTKTTMQNVSAIIDCRCDDCGTITIASKLEEIDDIGERLDPGSIVPAGQCPECGALAYYLDEVAPAGSAQAQGHKMHDLLCAAHTIFDGEEESVKEEHADFIAELNAFLGDD